MSHINPYIFNPHTTKLTPSTLTPSTWPSTSPPQESPAGFPTTSSPGNARYPITFFSGIHPGDAISLGDPPELVQAARDTVEAVNAINWWSPTNGLCMAWPPASRVSNDAAATLASFDRALNSTLQPNLWPWIHNRPTGGWGCPVEQAGATLAINDLLVQSHEGFLRLFPAGWPAGSPASFVTLRADGGFLVSAATDGGGVPRDVVVRSLAGRNCSVKLPSGWAGVAVHKLAGAGAGDAAPFGARGAGACLAAACLFSRQMLGPATQWSTQGPGAAYYRMSPTAARSLHRPYQTDSGYPLSLSLSLSVAVVAEDEDRSAASANPPAACYVLEC